MRCDFCQAVHAFDSRRVQERWWPKRVRCLIIGESPGEPGAEYFYDPVPENGSDPVGIRSNLLSGLLAANLINSKNLQAFKESGFVFDHAIRCAVDIRGVVETERQHAVRYNSQLAHRATYLSPLITEAEKVWVMGHIARDDVVFLSQGNYPGMGASLNRKLTPPAVYAKFFFSRYLNRCPDKGTIFRKFSAFLQP